MGAGPDQAITPGDIVTSSGTTPAVTLEIDNISNASSRWRARDEDNNLIYDSNSNTLADFNTVYNDTIVNQLYWVDDPNVVCPNNTSKPGISVGAGSATTGGSINCNYTAPEAGTEIVVILGGYNYNASMEVGGDVNEAGTNLEVYNSVSITPRYRFVLTTTGTTGSFSLTWNNSGTQIVYILYAGPAGAEKVEVISISDTEPKMTVSGGTWNVGETVKNTVARAPVITPTTDEITDSFRKKTEQETDLAYRPDLVYRWIR